MPTTFRHRCVILRMTADCTNHGVTSPARSDAAFALLLTPDQVRDKTPDFTEGPSPVPILVFKDRGESLPPIAVPVAAFRAKRHTMAGGNYITSSDSRFRSRIAPHPIAVHDRIES